MSRSCNQSSNLSSLILITIKLLNKIKKSTFITSICQMIMTFNVITNFALSQMSNCKYNDIQWFTTRSTYTIWGTIFIWIVLSCTNYLLTRIWKVPFIEYEGPYPFNVLILLQLYANKNLKIGTGVYPIKKA